MAPLFRSLNNNKSLTRQQQQEEDGFSTTTTSCSGKNNNNKGSTTATGEQQQEQQQQQVVQGAGDYYLNPDAELRQLLTAGKGPPNFPPRETSRQPLPDRISFDIQHDKLETRNLLVIITR